MVLKSCRKSQSSPPPHPTPTPGLGNEAHHSTHEPRWSWCWSNRACTVNRCKRPQLDIIERWPEKPLRKVERAFTSWCQELTNLLNNYFKRDLLSKPRRPSLKNQKFCSPYATRQPNTAYAFPPGSTGVEGRSLSS